MHKRVFQKGWTVTKSDNRVGVSPNPITQPVTDASGNNVSQVFLPHGKGLEDQPLRGDLKA
ncbi:Uncharacterised protein [Raoultella planticola]|uniref:Uncharacterized protein n=1 Tax=Raoultella planticola TaxID=575 RepID=A0A485CRQ5_RAOPL|nr:Uncharacterised protein [Raoultella planticola]